jgi:trigger factor
MASQKETMIPRIKENSAADELAKRLDAEVPQNVVDQIESELLQDFFTQLQQRGLTFDSYLNSLGIDNNQFKADIKKQAEEQAKQEMALDAWAAHFGIEATDEDVRAEFVKAGVSNPEELEDQWKKQGRLYLIREGINRAKAMDDILEKAIVKEVDFKEKAAQNDSEKEK